QVAAGVVDVHEPLAHAGYRAAVPRGVLLGVGDVQLAAQVLDVERGEPRGEVAVGERAEPVDAEGDLVELAVEDVDLAVVEVGGVQEVRRADVGRGQAGVDGPVGRLEADLGDPGQHPEGSLYGRPDPRVPAGDPPGLRREEEHRRPG